MVREKEGEREERGRDREQGRQAYREGMHAGRAERRWRWQVSHARRVCVSQPPLPKSPPPPSPDPFPLPCH